MQGLELTTGKERDAETGLDYFGARYLSSAQGRFTSPDEFKGGGLFDPLTGKSAEKIGPLPYADISDPQTLNKYAYVRNNPLKFVDPDGHETTVLYDRDEGTITIFSWDGSNIHVESYPANNNVDSQASIGRLVDGEYQFQDKEQAHKHGEAVDKKGVKEDSANGEFGEEGIYRLEGFKGADGQPHKGVGLHAGRADVEDKAGRSGPDFATQGCVRTTDEAMKSLAKTTPWDSLKSLFVKHNRKPPQPKPNTDQGGDSQ